MPIYEYRCNGCKRRVSIFFRSIGSVGDAQCPRCGSAELTRLVSRVAVHRSHGDDDIGDTGGGDEFDDSFAGLDEDDPRAMAQALRRMSAESGEPLEPEMEEALGRLEAGEDPETAMAGLDESSGEADDFDDEF